MGLLINPCGLQPVFLVFPMSAGYREFFPPRRVAVGLVLDRAEVGHREGNNGTSPLLSYRWLFPGGLRSDPVIGFRKVAGSFQKLDSCFPKLAGSF